MKDIIIIGGGPAGVAAAAEASRLGLDTLLIEKEAIGGLALRGGDLAYDGKSLTAEEMQEELIRKLKESRGETVFDEVVSGALVGPEKKVKTASGKEYFGKTVIIAGGTHGTVGDLENDRELPILNSLPEDLNQLKEKTVAITGTSPWIPKIVGLLSPIADTVHVFSPDGKDLPDDDNVIPYKGTVKGIDGKGKIQAIHWFDGKAVQTETAEEFKLFVFGELLPNTDIYIRMDMEDGFIETTDIVETNIPGVFASGDIRAKRNKNIDSAMEDGVAAARACEKYLKEN